MLLGDSSNFSNLHRTFRNGAKVTTCRVTGRVNMDLFGTSVCGVSVLCSLLFSNFCKLSSKGVCENTLPSSSLHVMTMPTYVGSRPADLWQKGLACTAAAQEHFGILVLL